MNIIQYLDNIRKRGVPSREATRLALNAQRMGPKLPWNRQLSNSIGAAGDEIMGMTDNLTKHPAGALMQLLAPSLVDRYNHGKEWLAAGDPDEGRQAIFGSDLSPGTVLMGAAEEPKWWSSALPRMEAAAPEYKTLFGEAVDNHGIMGIQPANSHRVINGVLDLAGDIGDLPDANLLRKLSGPARSWASDGRQMAPSLIAKLSNPIGFRFPTHILDMANNDLINSIMTPQSRMLDKFKYNESAIADFTGFDKHLDVNPPFRQPRPTLLDNDANLGSHYFDSGTPTITRPQDMVAVGLKPHIAWLAEPGTTVRHPINNMLYTKSAQNKWVLSDNAAIKPGLARQYANENIDAMLTGDKKLTALGVPKHVLKLADSADAVIEVGGDYFIRDPWSNDWVKANDVDLRRSEIIKESTWRTHYTDRQPAQSPKQGVSGQVRTHTTADVSRMTGFTEQELAAAAKQDGFIKLGTVAFVFDPVSGKWTINGK